MTIQQLDVDLIKAIAWPAVAAGAIAVFRKPAAELLRIVAERLSKISIAGVSLEGGDPNPKRGSAPISRPQPAA